MNRQEILEKLISVRHHCFKNGVVGKTPEDCYRAAFRDLNRLYVQARDNGKRNSLG